MRSGQLAEVLAERGHDVLWWAATFDHLRKRHRSDVDRSVRLSERLHIEMLHSRGYRSNISMRRVLDHRELGRRFRRNARLHHAPDVILASLPPLEICAEAVSYAKERGIPLVVDVRDLWPDIFLFPMPTALRPLGRIALFGEFRRLSSITRDATALTAVSDDYLSWALRKAGREPSPWDRVFHLGYEVRRPATRSDDFDWQKIGVDRLHLVLAFVGTFGRTYDLATVIRAARELWNAGVHDVRFVLGGDGEQGDAWRRLAAGLPNVVFPGWLSASQIWALLERADVGLAAYAVGAPQSLPNKPFEYMSGGLVLMSSLGGELQTLIRRYGIGYSYPPGDVSALVARVQGLRDDRELTRQMGLRSKALFLERFDSGKLHVQMAEYLIELARSVEARQKTGVMV